MMNLEKSDMKSIDFEEALRMIQASSRWVTLKAPLEIPPDFRFSLSGQTGWEKGGTTWRGKGGMLTINWSRVFPWSEPEYRARWEDLNTAKGGIK